MANVEIKLTHADMRAILLRETGEPCFRMWVTEMEAAAITDWTLHRTKDGRYAVWRPESTKKTWPTICGPIERRLLTDDE